MGHEKWGYAVLGTGVSSVTSQGSQRRIVVHWCPEIARVLYLYLYLR